MVRVRVQAGEDEVGVDITAAGGTVFVGLAVNVTAITVTVSACASARHCWREEVRGRVRHRGQ